MLSDIKNIQNPKELCGYLNGRTVTQPMSRINRLLASYRNDEYLVKAVYHATGVGATRQKSLELQVAMTSDLNRPIRVETLSFPMSRADFVKAVVCLDQSAEARLQGRRNQLGLS